MRILVADRLPERFVEAMRTRGHECEVDAALTETSLPGSMGGVDVLVVRSTRVAASVFAASDSLRLVVRAGSGTNTIDCDEATRTGVLVANVPGRNSVAVAELTMGLLLAVDRAIPDNTSELRAAAGTSSDSAPSGAACTGGLLASSGWATSVWRSPSGPQVSGCSCSRRPRARGPTKPWLAWPTSASSSSPTW